ncbi:MAG: hypothetical protein K4571_07475 [Deltaproteobacteria bacterium]
MPSRSNALFAMLVVVLILFISAKLADAGGGVNHTVKVRNKTSCSMKVYLFTYNGDSYGPKESSGYDEVKFETGAKCPDRVAINNICHDDGANKGVSVCTNDGQTDGHCKKLNCESSTWKVEGHYGGQWTIRRD